MSEPGTTPSFGAPAARATELGPAPRGATPAEPRAGVIEKPHRNLARAYLYLLTLGWLGLHRFYLRRWYTGALYAVSFGFFGVGLLLDVFLVPLMTRWANRELDELFRKDPERFRRTPERIAPWATNAGRFDAQVFLVGLFWLIAAPMLAMLAVMFGFPWGPLYLVVMLLLVALVGSTKQLRARYPSLGQAPLISPVVAHLVELEDFYYDHRPRPLLYYLAFPVTAPVASLFSRQARTEARILLWPVGVVLLGLAVDVAWSFSDHFKDSIAPSDAVSWLASVVIVSGLIIAMFLLPTVTTALALNLSGRRRYTRFFAGLAIVVGLPFTVVTYQIFTNRITIPASDLLERRLENPDFRATLSQVGRMFLAAHRPASPLPLAVAELDLTVEYDEPLSEELQRILVGFLPESEAPAFRVWRVVWDGAPVLTGIQYAPDPDPSEPPDPDEICMRQPVLVADQRHTYASAEALGRVLDLNGLADRFGQGQQTWLLDDWPCEAKTAPPASATDKPWS